MSNAVHPATRILALLELLQTHGRLSGSDLAGRLDVTPRTVRRYVAKLEDMGIPITAGFGATGGYELVAGFKLPPMMFTGDEAVAISLGLAAVRGFGLTETAESVAGAQAKLERVMPPNLTRRVRSIHESVAFSEFANSEAAGSATLAVLSAGAHSRQGVRLRYQPRSGCETERGFDPYGLAFTEGRWYAAGYCHLRRGLRTFRLDRVLGAELEERSFERPEKFDILSHLSASLALLPRSYAVEVWIEAELAAVRKDVPPAVAVLEARGDRVLLRSQVDDLDWFARELAGLKWQFEVVSPPELVDAVERRARALMAMVRR